MPSRKFQDRVKMLPMNETVDFKFTFDPRGALREIGPVEVSVPINIVDGPTINLRVRAQVTMPAIAGLFRILLRFKVSHFDLILKLSELMAF